jgi:amino acid adenylation domain-containing protein
VSSVSPSGGNLPASDYASGSSIPLSTPHAASPAAKSKIPSIGNIVTYVTRWAEETPKSPALKAGEMVLNYRELEERSGEIARRLQLMGVGRDVVVGVYAERSIGLAVAALGIMRAGGAYLPLDPSHPRERLAYQVADAQVDIVVAVEGTAANSIVDLANHVLRCGSDGTVKVALGGKRVPTQLAPDDLAYVIYTSGSTGRPKGVEIAHGNLQNLIQWYVDAVELSETDRVSHVAAVSFDATVWELWPALAAGACVCIADAGTVSDPVQLQDWLIEERITASFIPTPMAEKLMAMDWPVHTELRTVMTGGDTLHAYPRPGLPFRLVNNYGPTECTVCATSAPVTAENQPERLPPIGRPVANTQIYIVDESLRPVPDGVEGEILIGGRGVGRGYRNRPDLTMEKFITNPFDPTNRSRVYRTGDRGYFLPDGQIVFKGRTDNQIKVRGVRMEAGEIEVALNAHDALKESAVVASEFAPGDKRLVAYIVPGSRTIPSPSELRLFLAQMLPSQMIPSIYVLLDRLPLNSSGKIDRSALPAPTKENMTARETGGGPRDALEKQLKEIWEGVFKIGHIGVCEDFFELGGHSLLAAQLMVRVNESLRMNLPLSSLLEVRTIEEMAEAIRAHSTAENWSSLVAVQPKGSNAPLFCVHSHTGDVLYCEYIAQGAGPQQPIYGLQAQGAVGRNPHHTIEEMAAHYVRELRKVRPQGPYHLFGFCFGGMVAFEMANQLNQEGEQVAFLGVYNSPAPGTLKGWPLGQFTYLWRRTQDEWRKLLALDPGEQVSHIKKNIRNFRLLVQRSAAIEGAETLSRIRRDGSGAALKDLEAINIAAAKRFAPRYVFPGKITLFIAPDMATVYPVPPAEGWKAFAARGVETISVPLDKQGWRGAPFVETVGGKVKEFLRAPDSPASQIEQDARHLSASSAL